MIIPRHKICDICERDLIDKTYVTIPQDSIYVTPYCGDSIRLQRKMHICADCWDKITREIADRIDYKGQEED